MGVLLHELATGETDLRQGKIPRPLGPVIARCVQFDPDKRYPNASALEAALKKAEKPAKLHLWPLLLLLALLLSAIPAWTHREPAGSPQPDLYVFASPAVEAEVCRQLGKEPGTVSRSDLDAMESLLLCGTEAFERWEQLTSYGYEVQIDGRTVDAQGGIDTLEDIPQMKNLRTLALCNQDIASLSPLSGCRLTQLALHGNRISDLTPLAECPFLQELDISGNTVSDMSPLQSRPSLWKLNAGGTALQSLDSLAGLPVLGMLLLHDCPLLTDISALEGMESVTALHLRPVSGGQLEVIGRTARLQYLGLWQVEGMVDFTPLSRLSELLWLFVDTGELASLDGIEQFQKLGSLDVRSHLSLDVTPLNELKQLSWMNVTGLSAKDWSPLAHLPALEYVACMPGQEEAIQKVLGGRDPTIETIHN